jgi:hypothetical protein
MLSTKGIEKTAIAEGREHGAVVLYTLRKNHLPSRYIMD